MTADPAQVLQHLAAAARAFGSDLPLPRGQARLPPGPPPAPARAGVAAAQPAEPAPIPARPATDPRGAPPTDPPAVATAPPTAQGADDPAAALAALREELLPCTRCKLHRGRTTVVFGEGDPRARVVFVGEAPGAQEDRTGRPFVGPAGQLLDRILGSAMGLRRTEVYIANVNKCRPPDNRQPEADEVAACLPHLRRQVEIVRPEVIVCLGRTAAQNLLGTTASTTALRGRELHCAGIPVVVTWHPAYLLRDPSHKRETWDDVRRVNRLLGRPEVPPPVAP